MLDRQTRTTLGAIAGGAVIGVGLFLLVRADASPTTLTVAVGVAVAVVSVWSIARATRHARTPDPAVIARDERRRLARDPSLDAVVGAGHAVGPAGPTAVGVGTVERFAANVRRRQIRNTVIAVALVVPLTIAGWGAGGTVRWFPTVAAAILLGLRVLRYRQVERHWRSALATGRTAVHPATVTRRYRDRTGRVFLTLELTEPPVTMRVSLDEPDRGTQQPTDHVTVTLAPTAGSMMLAGLHNHRSGAQTLASSLITPKELVDPGW